jgi:hypothetical protein
MSWSSWAGWQLFWMIFYVVVVVVLGTLYTFSGVILARAVTWYVRRYSSELVGSELLKGATVKDAHFRFGFIVEFGIANVTIGSRTSEEGQGRTAWVPDLLHASEFLAELHLIPLLHSMYHSWNGQWVVHLKKVELNDATLFLVV